MKISSKGYMISVEDGILDIFLKDKEKTNLSCFMEDIVYSMQIHKNVQKQEEDSGEMYSNDVALQKFLRDIFEV